VNRRRLLAAIVAGTAGLAGCAGSPDSDADTDTGPSTDGADPTGTAPATTDAGASTDATASTRSLSPTLPDGADAPTDDGLDLREANVTAVAVSRSGDGYRFDVTLYHDDDGEDGYADRWQVEALDGTRLGRRDLLHAHGTREFTRSATVSLPDPEACVVVRGHDRTHGYGGQAALVVPATGAVRLLDRGPERAAFGPGDCPS
jgi:hypothetical protein